GQRPAKGHLRVDIRPSRREHDARSLGIADCVSTPYLQPCSLLLFDAQRFQFSRLVSIPWVLLPGLNKLLEPMVDNDDGSSSHHQKQRPHQDRENRAHELSLQQDVTRCKTTSGL